MFYYAPWCKTCTKIREGLEKLAGVIKELGMDRLIGFGALDIEVNQLHEVDVQDAPT